jgi:hypothetical protein
MEVYNVLQDDIIDLIKNSEKIYDVNFEYNKHTFYYNIWVCSWNQIIPDNFNIILNFMLERKIIQDTHHLLSIGIIQSLPDCNDQPFHYDYLNKTTTIFIPLVDLDYDNGTEYIEMINNNYYDYVEKLIQINYKTNNYKEVTKIIGYENNQLKRVVASKYSFVKLNKYIFHRGVKNKKPQRKIMFQFLFTDDPTYVFKLTEKFYPIASEDEGLVTNDI